MTTRNFEFRVSPRGGQREGRWIAADDIVIGAPVILDDSATENELGLQTVELATGAQAPQPGLSGIAYYEYIQYQGDDPYLTTWSDKGVAPGGKAVQVVRGDTVKVGFRNTREGTFLVSRSIPARTMVAGEVAVGDLLTPGSGTDGGGYWAVTNTASQGWLVVTNVDDATGEIEARMLF